MKRPLLILLALLAALAHPARAEAPQPKLVEVEARFIRATETQMLDASKAAGLGDAVPGSMSQAQLTKLIGLLKKGGADLLGSPRAVANFGAEATVESIRELRYPTEFSESKDEPGKHIPISFETRNVGATLVFTASLTPEQGIKLKVTMTEVSFLGFIDYGSSKPASTHDRDAVAQLLKAPLQPGGLWQPIFSTAKTNTEITLSSGTHVLLGGAPGNADDRLPETEAPRMYLLITARLVETK